MSERHFIFTITTGRSGSDFLAQLLKSNLTNARVHHEQLKFTDWGVNTPELSHLGHFNHIGNSSYVQAFWRQKFARIKALNTCYFAETSHVLAKAGLVENIESLAGVGTVHLVYLKRDIADTVISFVNRADFINKGNMWLWYLDTSYPNVIVKADPFIRHGQIGRALWYVIEMRVRAEYYRLLLADSAEVMVHDLDLETATQESGASRFLAGLGMEFGPTEVKMPGVVNANKRVRTDEAQRQQVHKLVSKFRFDPAELARRWYQLGRRLARQ